MACFGRSSCIGGVSNINRAGRTYITLIMNFYKIAVFCNKSIVFEYKIFFFLVVDIEDPSLFMTEMEKLERLLTVTESVFLVRE